jgi:hypothetical protein
MVVNPGTRIRSQMSRVCVVGQLFQCRDTGVTVDAEASALWVQHTLRAGFPRLIDVGHRDGACTGNVVGNSARYVFVDYVHELTARGRLRVERRRRRAADKPGFATVDVGSRRARVLDRVVVAHQMTDSVVVDYYAFALVRGVGDKGPGNSIRGEYVGRQQRVRRRRRNVGRVRRYDRRRGTKGWGRRHRRWRCRGAQLAAGLTRVNGSSGVGVEVYLDRTDSRQCS